VPRQKIAENMTKRQGDIWRKLIICAI